MARQLVIALLLAVAFAVTVPSWVNYYAGAQMPGGRGGGGASGEAGAGGGRGEGGRGGRNQVVPVVTAVATREDVPVYLDGIGSVKAFNTVSITPLVSGAITQVNFKEGQMVGRGALLAQIDPRPYENALAQAQGQLIRDRANLANAELDLRRYRILATENSIALQQVDTQAALVQQLQGVVKTDEAAVQNAALNVENCRILSPIAGRTGLRQIDIGNIVQPGATNVLVTVTQLQPISAIFTVPQDAFEQVRVAMRSGAVPVYASTTDGATQLDTGTLLTLDNEIDQATGTVRLKATFPNAGLSLWPGEFINSRVLLRMELGVVTVPRVAVQQGPNGPFVYVIGADDRAEQRPVRTGITQNGVTVIAEGVRAGERVVTEGQFRLVAGARVSLAPMLVARANRRP